MLVVYLALSLVLVAVATVYAVVSGVGLTYLFGIWLLVALAGLVDSVIQTWKVRQ